MCAFLLKPHISFKQSICNYYNYTSHTIQTIDQPLYTLSEHTVTGKCQ